VTLIQAVLLDLKTIADDPSIYDLPINPLFGTFTAQCTAPSRVQDGASFFTLSRKIYNPFANSYTTMDVPCFYNPNNGRHSSVTTATNGKAIFTVAGELFVGKRMVQIVGKEIEWLFPVSENTNNKGNKSGPSSWKAQKSKYLDFEEKYFSNKKRSANHHQESPNKRPVSQADLDLNEESPSDPSTRRTTMFQNAMNAVATSSKGKECADLIVDANLDEGEGGVESEEVHTRGAVDVSFLSTYVKRNEINQNLQNAPPNNQPNIPSPHYYSHDSTTFQPWRPSKNLILLLEEFDKKILYDYPSTPCAYCSILMMSTSIKWINYNADEEYTLKVAFPNEKLSLKTNNNGEVKVAVCSSCKTEKNRRFPPALTPVPDEINSVVLQVLMLTHYRHLQGFIGLSKNRHALELHSGLIGAILNQNEPPNWFHESLIGASQWLVQNNPIYIQYNQTHAVTHPSPSNPFPEPLPMARLATQTIHDTSSLNHHSSILTNPQPPSLVVPNNDFPIEVHEEDYRYQRLMAGFVTSNDDVTLPIQYNNPDIEALVFPDIFPAVRGHYEDVKRLLEFRHNTDSYGKYIKLRILCPDPRFRLHWYWPHWSYLNLEKKRNYQNKNRILNQKNVNPLTTTLPSSIRTSEAFFRKKQHQVNTMVQGYGLPQIFYTMTMSEGKWKHLQEILLLTDNHDPLPSNRPLHAYLHYHNRLTNVRNKLWKNPNLVQWEKKIPDLIAKNTICADVPDPLLEPELFQLVTTYQIHRCVGEKCGDPGTNANPCKKGFPQPLSNFTYCEQNSKRYIYRRTKDEDCWVVPYHPETLLIWQGHINFQYITTFGFGKYVTKYATKPEPNEIFNIISNNKVFSGGSIPPIRTF
ncbi:3589_t:CDS:2, partial [Entrophospora sp. SA101]